MQENIYKYITTIRYMYPPDPILKAYKKPPQRENLAGKKRKKERRLKESVTRNKITLQK